MTGTEQIAQLTTEVTNATTVEASATTFINGFAAALAAAVQAAIGNGATQVQLQPLTDLGVAAQAQTDALAAAITANTH